jgi:hypothetical protein
MSRFKSSAHELLAEQLADARAPTFPPYWSLLPEALPRRQESHLWPQPKRAGDGRIVVWERLIATVRAAYAPRENCCTVGYATED